MLDQNTNNLQKVMQMTEHLSTVSNSCGSVRFPMQTMNTDGQGRFEDNFFMCDVPICLSGGSCTVVRDQTWRADTHSVGDYQLTYQCGTFGIVH